MACVNTDRIEVAKNQDGSERLTLRRAKGAAKKSETVRRKIAACNARAASRNVGAGGRLVSVLNQQMQINGDTLQNLSKKIDYSVPHIKKLAKDGFSKANLNFLRRISEYLDTPLPQVMLLADVLSAEDFFYKSASSEIAETRRAIASCPQWMGFAPDSDEWNSMSQRMRLLITMLYEQVSGETIVRKAQVPYPEALCA